MHGNFKNNGEFLNFLYNDCSYFWGQITREEAKEILEGKPNGSFLLREKDLTREYNNFQFEVAVKIRSGVFLPIFRSNSLAFSIIFHNLENCHPVHRIRPFTVQELCRSKIRGSGIAEDGINQLELPGLLKKYLKE